MSETDSRPDEPGAATGALAAYFAAYDEVLTPLQVAANTLDLLHGARESGVLDRLRERATVADLVATSGADPALVDQVCRALVATRIAQEDEDGTFTLTPPWMLLSDPKAFSPLAVQLRARDITGSGIRAGAAAASYWAQSSEDRVTIARSVSVDPTSPEMVAFARDDARTSPLLRELDREGGRILELGCGVAGTILVRLQAMPRVSAVGVELTEDLARVARERAAELGVADRFEVVCGDAADFVCDEPFDFGFWSQFFFPEPSRAAALATMMRCLRSGGELNAPLGGDFEAMDADPDGVETRDFHLTQVLQRSWGIPSRRPEELQDEVARAGFVDVRLVDKPWGQILSARRP